VGAFVGEWINFQTADGELLRENLQTLAAIGCTCKAVKFETGAR